MSLHIISRVNGPYKPGTWFQCDDDGCQQVEIEQSGTRVRVVREIGFIRAHDDVLPYCTSIMKTGVLRHGVLRGG